MNNYLKKVTVGSYSTWPLNNCNKYYSLGKFGIGQENDVEVYPKAALKFGYK